LEGEWAEEEEAEAFESVEGPVGVMGGIIPVYELAKPTDDPEPGRDP